MSRDWTPLEHYIVEQQQIKDGFGDIFALMDNLKFVSKDGNEEIIHTPEEMAVRRQFPMLGKFLIDGFVGLYERLSKIEGGIDFLHQKDNELAKVVENKEFDENSDLVKWFTGRLDEGFYYCERNNRLFVQSMINEAQEFAFKNKKEIFEKTVLDENISRAQSLVGEQNCSVSEKDTAEWER